MSHPRVVHFRKANFDVLIDRSTKWGNPFSHKASSHALVIVDTRRTAVQAFEDWLISAHDLDARWMRDHIGELKGKTLGCWCAPESCHGEILVYYSEHPDELATGRQKNEPEPPPTLF